MSKKGKTGKTCTEHRTCSRTRCRTFGTLESSRIRQQGLAICQNMLTMSNAEMHPRT